MKRKLVWLGTHSFMFRTCFARYMEEHAAGGRTSRTPTTSSARSVPAGPGWGLSTSWRESSTFPMTTARTCGAGTSGTPRSTRSCRSADETLQAVNVINDQPYRIRIDMKRNPFKPGQLLFGSLVPWRGEWYWSGEQQLLGDASKVDVDDLKRTMKRQSPAIVCRYSKEYEAQVRQLHVRIAREDAGLSTAKDLVVYPDGLSMAADWQKELRWQWESRPQQEVEEVIEKHGLKKGRPEIKIPKDLLEEKDGLGVFLNPDEGKEIMTHFTPLIAGLKKKGEGLTEDEEEVIRGFFDSDAISPRFVRRVLEEYGDESVKAAFLLKGDLPGYWLDYLLRSRKGHFYRKRYPALAVV